MPRVSQAVKTFLSRVPHNCPEMAAWYTDDMELQVMVAADNGEPVAEKRNTWSDGVIEWGHIRVPKNADTEPFDNDYEMRWPLHDHVEYIGMTGWDWRNKRSIRLGYDFDALVGHAVGVGVSKDELTRVREAVERIPQAWLFRSTSGNGLHLYLMFDPEKAPQTNNHHEHAALARSCLGVISNLVNFNFEASLDVCGSNMWIWGRKMTEENLGLSLIKRGEGYFEPPDRWRDHISVITRKRTKVEVSGAPEGEGENVENLAASRRVIPLDATHRAVIDALQELNYTTHWVPDHNLLQTHTRALQEVSERFAREGSPFAGHFVTLSDGNDPGKPNCLSGETMVITRDGSKPIRDLAGTTATVLTREGKWIDAPFKSYGKQQIFKITIQQGQSTRSIKATPDHGWFIAGRVQSNSKTGRAKFNHQRRVETQNLQVGDKLVQVFASTHAKLTPSVVGIQHGLVWGDGDAHKQVGEYSPAVGRLRLFGEKDKAVLSYFNLHPQRPIKTKTGVTGIEITNLPGHFKSLVNLGYDKPYLYGWLAGYFAADGYVSELGCCILRSHSRQSIQHVRDVCNLLGIGTSPITEGKSGKSSYLPGVPVFTTILKRAHLAENFFLIHEHKRRYLATGPAKYYAWTVKSIESVEPEEVFCCTIPETGCFVLEDNILTSNCFCFPCQGGSFKVIRFGNKAVEDPSWCKDTKGWTYCYFNRKLDLLFASKAYGGLEDDSSGGGYLFSDARVALEAVKAIGSGFAIPDELLEFPTKLKTHKDGRVIVEVQIPKSKQANLELEKKGWYPKGNKASQVLNVLATPLEFDTEKQTLDLSDIDGSIRSLLTSNYEEAGWALFDSENNHWARRSKDNIKSALRARGYDKEKTEEALGICVDHSWILVNIPFAPELPGNRQWNVDAAQFRYQPVPYIEDNPPKHPHWDLVLEHCGQDLDESIKTNEWARKNGVRNGKEYLQCWVASMLRYPFEPLPYLFLFGPQNSGKSILHEAISLLIAAQKGVIHAERALTSPGDFNGELANAILCVVEETDLSVSSSAVYNKIKDWVTSLTISIHAKRLQVYSQRNTTHWMQMANGRSACPVFPGDTRITMMYVPLPDKEIPKNRLISALEDEAPQFMATLLSLRLPEPEHRLRIPVIITSNKEQAEDSNRDALEQFISEEFFYAPGQCVNFNEFFEQFQATLNRQEREYWNRRKVQQGIPQCFVVGRYSANKLCIGNISATKPDGAPSIKFSVKDQKLTLGQD